MVNYKCFVKNDNISSVLGGFLTKTTVIRDTSDQSVASRTITRLLLTSLVLF